MTRQREKDKENVKVNIPATATSDDFLDDLLGDFLDESAELFERLNEDLLQLDSWIQSFGDDPPPRCDVTLVNELFRNAHSLKGLSAMLGFSRIKDLTHEVENVFDAVRNDHLLFNAHVIQLIFQAVDGLEAMVDRVKNQADDNIDSQPVLEGIRQLLEDAGADRKQTSQEEAEQVLSVVKSNNIADESAADSTGEAPASKLSATTSPAIENERTSVEGTASNQTTASDETTASTETPSTEASKQPSETLRVDIDRLDQLMNLAGQLVTNKAQFTLIDNDMKGVMDSKRGLRSLENTLGMLDQLVSGEGDRDSKPASLGNLDNFHRHIRQLQADLAVVCNQVACLPTVATRLTDAVHQLDQVSSGIQKTVMDTRMVPIGPLFSRFRRVIRDIARDNGKDIALVIRGEKTELDKRLIDELGDPLVHMIRNSADHGIELPDARVAAGKQRQGTITLDAFHRGSNIFVQITDDGKGLDANKIREKAVQKGLVSASDADQLSDHQVFQLIWEPGFSTADQVTQVSGRGMGMDIVRSKIDELGASVDLQSEPGAGTTFTIKLPLTMAIRPSLLIEIDGDVFAIPIESVVEIVRVASQDLATVHGMKTACVRGNPISLVELSQLFSWNSSRSTPVGHDTGDASIVIIRSDRHEIGLVVHRLHGEEDVVIKSLTENYQNVEGIAGANILGDGRVALILDVAALIEMSLRQNHMENRGNALQAT